MENNHDKLVLVKPGISRVIIQHSITSNSNSNSSKTILNSACKCLKKYYKPSKMCSLAFLNNRFSFVGWLKNYKIKENIIKDLIGGITIGVLQIPQGMGYSLMSGLPAVNGLYVAFFSTLVYLFFGTSAHLSMGSYGVIALMIRDSLDNFEGKLYPPKTCHQNGSLSIHPRDAHADHISKNPNDARIMLAMSLSFFTGIFQLFLALIQGGVFGKYLSDTIVLAFTTGAAYHIIISELKSLLGVNTVHEYSIFKIAQLLLELFKNIKKTSHPTVIISIISIFVLLLVKFGINKRFKRKLIAPIPIELILICLGTVFSHFFEFKKRWNIEIVGEIPLGLPAPRIPPLKIIKYIYGDAIKIAIVSFALNLSIAKLFAKKHNYEINANQELFSYGVGNLLGSFFRTFPSSAGISRCVILDDIGIKTPLHNLFTNIVVLIVVLALGFLFKSLPVACLASLIVVVLIPMAVRIKEIVSIYKRNKTEAMAWLTTFFAVILLDIDIGLYIGVSVSLFLFVIKNQRATSSVMGNIPKTDIYEAIETCDNAVEICGIKIIRYEASIFYANVENFKRSIIKLSDIDPHEIIRKLNGKKREYMKKINKLKQKSSKIQKFAKDKLLLCDKVLPVSSISENVITNPYEEAKTQLLSDLKTEIDIILNSIEIKDIIIDFSCVNLIDFMGIDAITQINELYKECGIMVHLSNCKKYILRKFYKSSFEIKYRHDFIYPTTHEGVLRILKERNKLKRVYTEKSNFDVQLNKIEGDEIILESEDL